MSSLTVAAASVDITPEHPVPLVGYAARSGPYDEVADPLEANGLLMHDGVTTVVMITLDVLFVGQRMRDLVENALGDAVEPQNVWMCASHTHFAPAVETTKPNLGLHDDAYLKFCEERLRRLCSTLLSMDRRQAVLRLASATAEHTIHRRKLRWHASPRGVEYCQIAPNFTGPTDERVRRLDVVSDEKEVLATVWHYTCHPVTFPRKNEISAEYPGVVRASLRKVHSDRLPVLFLQGFTGDIRPRIIDRSTALVRRILRLVNGPQFGRFDNEGWRAWAQSLADIVVGLSSGEDIESVEFTANRDATPLSRIGKGADTERQITWQSLRFGPALCLFGMSAETVVEFAVDRPDDVLMVGYTDDVFGYYPTSSMLAENGYEVNRFQRGFGVDITFDEQLDSLVDEQYDKLVETGQ